MEITDVRLRKVNSENRLKAVASVTFDNEFVVHEIEHKDIAHPINPATREKIQKAILEVYNNTPEPEAKPETEASSSEE